MEPTREIPLTQNRVALVDAVDYDLVMGVGKWYADVHRGGRLIYAAHNVYRGPVRIGTERLHTFLTGWPLVDHINGNGLDNRRANLRPATRSRNQQNRSLPSNNRSGFKGVSYARARSRWAAYIRVNGRAINLGRYLTAEEAARAYDAAARELHGEFARLNFPKG